MQLFYIFPEVFPEYQCHLQFDVFSNV